MQHEDEAIRGSGPGAEPWPARATPRLEEQLAAALQRVAELEQALTTRIAIEQATGVLAERLGVGLGEASEILRRAARTHRVSELHIAGRVMGEPKTPGLIVVALVRGSRLRAAWTRELAEAHRASVEELHAAVREQLARLRARPPAW